MEDPRWLSPQEQRAWRAHLAAHRLLFHQLDRELQEKGLSLNDYEILVNLSESPDHRMRMSELADATIQSRSRLSHQISRMEAAGWWCGRAATTTGEAPSPCSPTSAGRPSSGRPPTTSRASAAI